MHAYVHFSLGPFFLPLFSFLFPRNRLHKNARNPESSSLAEKEEKDFWHSLCWRLLRATKREIELCCCVLGTPNIVFPLKNVLLCDPALERWLGGGRSLCQKMLLLSLSSEAQKPEPISVSLLLILPAQKDTTMGTSSKGKPRVFFSFFLFIREAWRFTKEVFFVKTSSIPENEEESICWMDILLFFFSPRIHRNRRGYLDFLLLGIEKLGWLEMEEEEERRGILGVQGMWPWWHFDFSAAQEKRRSAQSTPFCFAISRKIFSRQKCWFSFCLSGTAVKNTRFRSAQTPFTFTTKRRETELSWVGA